MMHVNNDEYRSFNLVKDIPLFNFLILGEEKVGRYPVHHVKIFRSSLYAWMPWMVGTFHRFSDFGLSAGHCVGISGYERHHPACSTRCFVGSLGEKLDGCARSSFVCC